jgi:hypothetical protein
VRGGEHIASAHVVHDAEVLLIRRTEFDKLANATPSATDHAADGRPDVTLLRNMDEVRGAGRLHLRPFESSRAAPLHF